MESLNCCKPLTMALVWYRQRVKSMNARSVGDIDDEEMGSKREAARCWRRMGPPRFPEGSIDDKGSSVEFICRAEEVFEGDVSFLSLIHI